MAGSADVKVNITTWFDDKGLTQAEREFRRAYAQQSRAAQEMARAEAQAAAQRTQAMHTVSNAIGALGLAMTAAAALAVSKWADFDQAMSNVAATGDDARGSIDALKDAAIEAGVRTAFSATEAANAIEELAKAGISAADILGGALDGALDLAAVGNMGVAEAAGIAAIAMTQFGLSGQDVSHVADLLAAGAGKAMGSVTDMGQALKQAGLVASQTGLSIEETVTALTAFAAAGMLGSDAGTSLKTMLQRLSAPSGEAASLMEDLGISAYNAAGEFVGLETLAGQLRGGLEQLTPAQRNAALATIFGADAVRAASVLYQEGAEGIATWTAAVDDQGYAAEVAATRMDNLKGDLEQLGGSFETWMIRMGESADGPLRGLVQGTQSAVDALSEMPPAAQGALMAIVGGGGLALLGAAGVMKLVTAINEARLAMVTLGVTAKGAALATAGIGGVFALAGLAVAAFAKHQQEATARVEGYTASLDAQSGAVTRLTRETAAKALQDEGAIDAARRLGVESGLLVDVILGVEGAQAQLNTELERFVGTAEMGAAEREQMLNDSNLIRSATEQQTGALQDAIAAEEAKREATESGTGATKAAAAAAQEYAQSLDALKQALDDLNGVQVSLIEATSAWEAALDEVGAQIEANGQGLDVTSESGRANMEVLIGMRNAAVDLAGAILDETQSEEAFRASLADSRQALANTAMSMGLSESAAWALVDSILSVPPTTTTTATFNTGAALAAADALLQKLASINGKTVYTYVNTVYSSTTGAQVSGAQYSTIAKNRGGIIGFAGGGLVPGTPPADPRADNVLATTGSGLYALRSGEWVSTEESSRRNRAALAAGNRGATLYTSASAAAAGMGGADPDAIGQAVARHMVGVTVELSNMRAMADTISGQIVRVHDRGI